MVDSQNTQRMNRKIDQEEKQFDERVLAIDRVARVVKGGRRFRFRALVVVGDKKNKVGVGSAKGADVSTAVSKAVDVAKKSMINVTLYKGTLPHDALTKVGGANILIKPASPGTGLIAGGVVRTILEVAGVHNALSKSLGSSNKTNTAYAVIEALDSMVPAKNWVTSKPIEKKDKKVTKAADSKTDDAKSEDKPKAKTTKATKPKTESKAKKEAK
ncbi:30S ribosomal protein S5 [Candidatus Saccharibacteria bacterium]|nr:30S ribosomal protein S5 [Candidatus Saccharibacteria bacterium]